MTTAVIGAGVIGLSCALELTELGEEVEVIDAAAPGAAASAGNAGWITPFLSSPRAAPGAFLDAVRGVLTPAGPLRMRPHLDSGFISWSLRFLRASTKDRHASGVAALHALSAHSHDSFDSLLARGVAFDLYRDGLGVVFKNSTNFKAFQQEEKRMRGLGYHGSISTYRGSEVQEFEPALHSGISGVLHLESERHVRPESLTRGLVAAVLARGGTIREHDAVTDLGPDAAGRWRLRLSSGEIRVVERVVVATGVAVRSLLTPLGVRIPIEAAKGVSLTAAGEGTAPTHPLKLYEDMVACSPFGNSVRMSGTFDVGARGCEINRKRLNMVVRQGTSYLKDWTPTQVEMEWAGHRPTSSDDLPIIGPVPGREGLYVATGHGTLGMTLGPITGSLVAQEIMTGKEQGLLKPFRLTRFA